MEIGTLEILPPRCKAAQTCGQGAISEQAAFGANKVQSETDPVGRVVTAVWFNPQTGAQQPPVTLTVSESGTAALPKKPNDADWVLYVE